MAEKSNLEISFKGNFKYIDENQSTNGDVLLIIDIDNCQKILEECDNLSGIGKSIGIHVFLVDFRVQNFDSIFKLLSTHKFVIFISSNELSANNAFNNICNAAVTSSWLIAHPSLAHNVNYRSDILSYTQEGKTNIKFIGHQTHLTPPEEIQNHANHKIESMRLGLVRQNIDRIEPWCRSIDHAIFYTESIRKTDFIAKRNPNMGGFTYEESCKIAQFLGASSHLSSLGIFGYDPTKDVDNSSANLIAQLVWYAVDGYKNFRADPQLEKSKLVQYVVHASHNDLDINFWKNNDSGRWWMEVPGHENYWISCTYDDYLEASHGEFSSKLIQVLNK